MPDPALVEPPPAPPLSEPRFPGRNRLVTAAVALGLIALAAVLLTLPVGEPVRPSVATPPAHPSATKQVAANPPAVTAPQTTPPAPPPAVPPAAPVVTTAATASINASSLPHGALFRLDGKRTARRRLTTSAGTHVLEVALDGYATVDDTVQLAAKQSLVWSPRLKRLPAPKSVAARPAPAPAPPPPPPETPPRRANSDEAACRTAMTSSAWREAYPACGRAASTGSVVGARSVAMLFLNGDGVRRSDDSAMHWFDRAAHAGDAESMYQLGVGFEKGHGVGKNPATALDWYTRAATAGNAAAQYAVGEAFEKGHLGATKDKARALEWYRKAAAQGDRDAASKVRDLDH